ncbi:MAG: TM0996/MTH895 family glutaredoxin-like protein [Candidatus Zixiibacteriota bacterium]|nr:MAG: TM0996/MTH895 family glutaredoxin-like protein [candidate division Zixibacteria bacterium]
MKKIEILGIGCPKCGKLAETAENAARELGVEYELKKITDVTKFASYGVMITPALVIDGKVKVSGKVPSLDELKEMLK